MTDPILPTAAPLVTACIDAMVAQRPSIRAPMNRGGRYTAVPTIVRAQSEVALARVADEVRSARLRLGNSGASLRALCASEFNTTLPSEPQTSLATVQLARWTGNVSPLPLPAGVIRKGYQFSKRANPNAHPLPIASATYETVQTTYVPQGQSYAMVLCKAVASGAAANVPNFGSVLGTFTSFTSPTLGTVTSATLATGSTTQLSPGQFIVVINAAGVFVGIFVLVTVTSTGVSMINTGAQNTILGTIAAGASFALSNTQIQPTAGLFDSTLQVIACEAAGGSSGLTDPVLIQAARAYAIGQYGPTDGALTAGALRQQSVRHFAFFRAGSLPYAQAYVADETWSSGAYWTSQVAQQVASQWLGFGCRIRWGLVVNQAIQLSASFTLTSTDAMNNTDDIDANVRAAARAYFDNRTDWYSFRTSALQGALSQADPNILTCTSVAVIDAATGAVVAVPANTFGSMWSPTITHYYIGASLSNTDNVITAQYFPPS